MSKITDRDNPEWTCDRFRKARPAREVFPHVDFPKPKGRGPQKAAIKVQTTIRLDRDVVEHFKALGRGWQSRINATLRGAVMQRRKKRA